MCRADGDWQFLCGDGDHSDSNAHLVGVGHLTDRDPTLNELVDLQPDYEAERGSVNDPWVISECDKFEE